MQSAASRARSRTRPTTVALRLGDYAAGALTAGMAAAAVHAVVETGWDMILAMGVGMGLGLVAHGVVLALAARWLGFFQVMAPGGIIGMYGGMLFGMRDSMQDASWPQALGVAALLGLLVVGGLDLYDRALRSAPASREEDPLAD